MAIGPQLERAQGMWQAQTPDRRRLIIIGASVAAMVIAGIVAFTSYVPYTTVYTGLTPTAAGQVVAALQTQKVPYRLSQNGTSIQVPTADADQVRITLATQNLPQQGQIGYSNVLSSSGFGVTDQQFNLAVLNALQNDLATTIGTMQGVTSATVQIVEPTQSAFAQPTGGGARASVYVNVASGSLPASEVNGIVQLVAHAVPGLAPANVAVVDQAGQLLSAIAASGTSTSSANGQLQAETAVENNLDQRITALLTPVTGPGNVVVDVHASLSFSQQSETQSLSTTTKGGVPTSKTSTTTTFKGTGGATPPAGVSGNVPGYTGTTSTGGNSSYTTNSTTIKYAVNHILRQIHSPPMTVTGFTVSVMVNQKAYPLTAAAATQLRNLVATAIGLPVNSAQATSDISIASAPFQGAPVPSTATTTTSTSNPLGLPLPLPELAAAGGGLLLLIVVLFLVMGRRRRRPQLQAVPPPQPSTMVIDRPPPPPDPNVERERRLIETVTESARSQPEEVANLLRGWLREEQ